MKFTIRKSAFRSPTPRTWLGIAIILISAIGTTWVISDNSQGTGIVLASRFIPAGTEITSEDVVEARILGEGLVAATHIDELIGKRVALDVAAGDLVTRRALDSTGADRRVIAVPLGIAPSTTITSGMRIQLWSVAPNGSTPPLQVATDVVVVATRRGSFGDSDLLDVSIASRDETQLLYALGSEDLIVAIVGSGST
jgi:hypothetical protein